MAIVESRAESSLGRLFKRLVFRKKLAVAEEQETPVLRMEDVFISPDSLIFTEFGKITYGISVNKTLLFDERTTKGRREEIISEINVKCKKIGISFDQFSEVESQLFTLIKKRGSDINKL